MKATLENRLAKVEAALGPAPWLREQRSRVAKNSETGKAIDYSLKRWTALIRFLDGGRLCMSNNAAERELRAVAVGRKNWTFAGSDEGGRRAAAIYTLIATAKLNNIDPSAWLHSPAKAIVPDGSHLWQVSCLRLVWWDLIPVPCFNAASPSCP